MKKIIIVLLLIVTTLLGCKNNLNIRIGDSMTMINNQQAPFIFLNSLSVFRTNNTYTIVVEKNGVAQKIVEFSSDRKCRTVQGLVLAKNEDVNQYLDKSLNELKEKFGEVHADIGSGFYVPAYITEQGYLIYFEVENDIVYEVIKRDLLTDVIVERLPQQEDRGLKTGDGLREP